MHHILFICMHLCFAYASSRLVPRRTYHGHPISRKDKAIINALRVLVPIYLFVCFLTYNEPHSYGIPGYTLLALSFALTTYAQRHNHYATPQFTLPGLICRTGPYRYIRHPIYTAAFLYYCSINWIFCSIAAIPICAAILWLYLARIDNEEANLQKISQEYTTYIKATPYKLFPYIY